MIICFFNNQSFHSLEFQWDKGGDEMPNKSMDVVISFVWCSYQVFLFYLCLLPLAAFFATKNEGTVAKRAIYPKIYSKRLLIHWWALEGWLETLSNSSINSQLSSALRCVPRLKPCLIGSPWPAFPPPGSTWGSSSFYAQTKLSGDNNSALHSTLPPRPSFCRGWWLRAEALQLDTGFSHLAPYLTNSVTGAGHPTSLCFRVLPPNLQNAMIIIEPIS